MPAIIPAGSRRISLSYSVPNAESCGAPDIVVWEKPSFQLYEAAINIEILYLKPPRALIVDLYINEFCASHLPGCLSATTGHTLYIAANTIVNNPGQGYPLVHFHMQGRSNRISGTKPLVTSL